MVSGDLRALGNPLIPGQHKLLSSFKKSTQIYRFRFPEVIAVKDKSNP